MASPSGVESLKNVSGIASEITAHLRKVYLTLAATTGSAACGVVFYLYTQFPILISFVASFAILLYLLFTTGEDLSKVDENRKDAPNKGLALLMAFGFFQGAFIGSLVQVVLQIDQNIVALAFVGTVAIFGSFSGSALFAKRRTYLFLGGFLGSMLSSLLLLSLLNLFLGSEWMHVMMLYGGLFMFCGFVLYDTQMIIEKANLGSRNHVRHALDLFIDFMAIFVRLLIILAKLKKKN